MGWTSWGWCACLGLCEPCHWDTRPWEHFETPPSVVPGTPTPGSAVAGSHDWLGIPWPLSSPPHLSAMELLGRPGSAPAPHFSSQSSQPQAWGVTTEGPLPGGRCDARALPPQHVRDDFRQPQPPGNPRHQPLTERPVQPHPGVSGAAAGLGGTGGRHEGAQCPAACACAALGGRGGGVGPQAVPSTGASSSRSTCSFPTPSSSSSCAVRSAAGLPVPATRNRRSESPHGDAEAGQVRGGVCREQVRGQGLCGGGGRGGVSPPTPPCFVLSLSTHVQAHPCFNSLTKMILGKP